MSNANAYATIPYYRLGFDSRNESVNDPITQESLDMGETNCRIALKVLVTPPFEHKDLLSVSKRSLYEWLTDFQNDILPEYTGFYFKLSLIWLIFGGVTLYLIDGATKTLGIIGLALSLICLAFSLLGYFNNSAKRI